ncbi:hypothetical protein T484DRAFT_1615332, partial [Baffinella frigidus]
PEARNPKPETRNPKPETRNPKPETRNPKPETQKLEAEAVAPHQEKLCFPVHVVPNLVQGLGLGVGGLGFAHKRCYITHTPRTEKSEIGNPKPARMDSVASPYFLFQTCTEALLCHRRAFAVIFVHFGRAIFRFSGFSKCCKGRKTF